METTSHPPHNTLPPLQAIESFFSNYSPETARDLLWKWLFKTAKENLSRLSKEETEQFALFFDGLQDLIEAAAELHLVKPGKEESDD